MQCKPITGTLRSSTAVAGAVLFFCSTYALAEAYPLWAGAATTDWEDAAHAVNVTDMSRCQPASALVNKTEKGHWKVIPYETTVSGPRGKLVWAAPRADAPELSLPLPVHGWYAVFVGLFNSTEVPTIAWLALDTDAAPVPRSNARDDYHVNTVETFFKVARLTGNNQLLISQQSHGFATACGVTHVRLIPLTRAEIERVEADRRDRSHRTMAATIDGFGYLYRRSPRTARELLSEVEIYRDTDFGTVLLHSPGADKVDYPSAVGHMKGTGYDTFPRDGDYYFTDSIRYLARQKINPVKVLSGGAHNIGMTVHVAIRPAGWTYLEPFCDYWESPFFQQNPQWRCQDRDGTPVARMSWAVPQVRQHLINLLREQVSFGADGVHLVFNRGFPVALYEEPARRLFDAQHHADPRTLDESDPRITRWWSDIVVAFFRELRAALDEEQQRPAGPGSARRPAVSLTALGTDQDNLRYGVDLRQLADEKLIDAVFTYLWDFGGRARQYDLAFFKEVCAPRGIPFKPATASFWDEGPYYTLDLIRSLYNGGASGITIWDAYISDIFQWSVIARMGHIEETRWRLDHLSKTKPPDQLLRFHKLGEYIMDGRFPPYWGG